ncbi:MAG: zinc metalloprotease [Flavobacteriaceae bacterium]|nr:zinc metalloprotease [Flavobacteriaceae bacterium]
MRKLILSALAVTVLLASCKNASEGDLNIQETAVLAPQMKAPCATMGVLEANVLHDPSIRERMAKIEKHTKDFIENKDKYQRKLVNGKIVIPIVFHVIYRSASENLSLSTLQAQVDALNADFNMQNPGRNTIPAEFAGVEANIGISFEIQQVIRVQNSKKRSWRPDDKMKYTSQGGSDVVNPQEYLNIWVVNQMPYRGGQILGYAQFPGGSWATDGVVLGANFVGGSDRTATHEVGHWLNLRHIWGDGGCGVDDFVADTPESDAPNRGCPTYPDVSCGSADMTMNFMDYTSDSCLNMFTLGQKARMDAVFAPGGFRASMAD